MAHKTMTSGATNAATMIPRRRNITFDIGSCRPWMLGCTETQVHKNIVIRQLRTISHSVLHSSFGPHEGDLPIMIDSGLVEEGDAGIVLSRGMIVSA